MLGCAAHTNLLLTALGGGGPVTAGQLLNALQHTVFCVTVDLVRSNAERVRDEVCVMLEMGCG